MMMRAEVLDYLMPMEQETVPTPAIVLEEPGHAILPSDVKSLIRSYVFGTPEQMSPTAMIFAKGGVLTKPFNKFFGYGTGACACILDVDENGKVGKVARGWPKVYMDAVVALQQITILSDPTYNMLQERDSVATLRKPIITAEDVMQFVLDIRVTRNRYPDGTTKSEANQKLAWWTGPESRVYGDHHSRVSTWIVRGPTRPGEEFGSLACVLGFVDAKSSDGWSYRFVVSSKFCLLFV